MSPSSVPSLPLRTVARWRELAAGGADPLPWLTECRAASRASAELCLWISLPSDAQWQAQLALLAKRLAEPLPRAELVRRYPLLGVPFAVKDNIDIAGAVTTAGCPAFAYTPSRSAGAVQRLLDAGALWLGKTNLDQFATGLVGTRSPYGRPASAFDPTRISGGSSSGSAVAVARGQVAFALGTDTAGSGRVPAGFNGLVGLKPTPGRVGTAGVVPACRSLDCVSVFAHTVDDAALVLALIEGDDAQDIYSHFVAGPARLPARSRIGVPKSPTFFGDAGYEPMFAAAIERARTLGQTVVHLDFEPLFAVAALLYDGPWVAERHSVVRELLAAQPEAFDPTVRQIIGRAAAFSATATFEAQYRLRTLQRAAAVAVAAGGCADGADDARTSALRRSRCRSDRRQRASGHLHQLRQPAGLVCAGIAGRQHCGRAALRRDLHRPGRHDAALVDFGRRWMGAAPAGRPQPLPAAEPTLPIAVVGAHLSGLPLNGQLLERGAVLREATRTAPHYRLYALPDTRPPKPGLQRCESGGAAIELEVWDMPQAQLGSFLALIPPPLGLGSVQLADGRYVHGFLCEAHALSGARDISGFGGWRAYLDSL